MNMLSGHAILYNTRKYKEHIINLFSEYKDIIYNTDVLVSRTQKKYLVLANKMPIFYQSNKYNKSQSPEAATKVYITEQLSTEKIR